MLKLPTFHGCDCRGQNLGGLGIDPKEVGTKVLNCPDANLRPLICQRGDVPLRHHPPGVIAALDQLASVHEPISKLANTMHMVEGQGGRYG